ncbi:MAG: hypothetical protein K6E32_03325 [Lachnospiraceae bacterium]|nr:hypothetical protein [Lachnospiraceae bacterium]
MINKEELTFDGFVFANPEDVELAKNEAKKIAYIESHTDTGNMTVMKGVYEKLIEARTFVTPVGFMFLRNIRDCLVTSGVSEEELSPVPLYTTFRRISLKDDEPKRKVRMTRTQKEELSLKLKYRNAIIISVIFGLLAVGMFVITMNGTTPNAINYKNAVTNQYAAWEQSLSEKESQLREKERAIIEREAELGITHSDDTHEE